MNNALAVITAEELAEYQDIMVAKDCLYLNPSWYSRKEAEDLHRREGAFLVGIVQKYGIPNVSFHISRYLGEITEVEE